MINTSWRTKIDAQQLFYFVIVPVRGTLFGIVVSMKARLELHTEAHGTLIFDKYEKCSPMNHERARRAEVGTIGYSIKL